MNKLSKIKLISITIMLLLLSLVISSCAKQQNTSTGTQIDNTVTTTKTDTAIITTSTNPPVSKQELDTLKSDLNALQPEDVGGLSN